MGLNNSKSEEILEVSGTNGFFKEKEVLEVRPELDVGVLETLSVVKQ